MLDDAGRAGGLTRGNAMKKFVFTMQSLLNVKSSLEKQAKADLADCQARLRLFLQEMDDIKHRAALKRNEFRDDMRRGGMTSFDMTTYFIGFRALQELVDAQQEKINICTKEKDRLQKKVVELMSERKMLEKLREKQREEYLEEAHAEDAKMMDDFMSYQVRKGGGREDG